MRLAFGDDANVAGWVAARIPQMSGGADFGLCTAIGVVSADGVPLGGVVFHNYQPRAKNIEVSFAAESARWLTRRLIVGLLSYPFDQLGVQRITTLTPKRNRQARAFIDAFGFKREGVLRKGFGDDDMIISGMLRKEWLRSHWMNPCELRPRLRERRGARHRPRGAITENVSAQPAPLSSPAGSSLTPP